MTPSLSDVARVGYECCRAYLQTTGYWSMQAYEGLHGDVREAWMKIARLSRTKDVVNVEQAHAVYKELLENLGWTYGDCMNCKSKTAPEMLTFEKLDNATKVSYKLFLAATAAMEGEHGNSIE